MFIVEIEGLEDCLHGELMAIVSDALKANAKTYDVVRVRYSDEGVAL